MRGGKRGGHKGTERVLAENEDDIRRRNMMEEEEAQKKKELGKESGSESDGSDSEESSGSDDSSSDGVNEVAKERAARRDMRSKGKAAEKSVVESGNINRGQKTPSAPGNLKVEISGKQKRELEAEKAKEAYFQKTLEGKTPEAKATLERLARIRAQREEAAKRRKEEEEAKAASEERIREQARLQNERRK